MRYLLPLLAGAVALLVVAVPLQVVAQTPPICSQAVHNSYTTVGPDGRTYPTWHSLRDPSGCYFTHEHGSNPALFGSERPAFGYAATNANMFENHEGFKTFVIPNDQGSNTWMFAMHFGTGGMTRVCVRMHELQLWAKPIGAPTARAAVVGMLDFGPTFENTGVTMYTPGPTNPVCTQTNDPNNHRLIPNSSQGGYEPWRTNLSFTALNISSSITINTRNPQFLPANVYAQESEKVPMWHLSSDGVTWLQNSGATRFVQTGTSGYPLTINSGGGAFCTDAMASARVTCTGTAGQLIQRVDAGYSAVFPRPDGSPGDNQKFRVEPCPWYDTVPCNADAPYTYTPDAGAGEADLDQPAGTVGVPN